MGGRRSGRLPTVSFESRPLERGAEPRGRRPEVIDMDINLPGMSGIDGLRALRAAPETKDIPVIALTAAASERDEQRGMPIGF